MREIKTPYTPRLYSKTEVCSGIPIFLFLLQNIYCGNSLEPPRRVLSKNKKNIKILQLKIFIFTTLKISVYCIGVYL